MWFIEQFLPSWDTIYLILTGRATRGWGDSEFSSNVFLWPLTLVLIILGYRDKLKSLLDVDDEEDKDVCTHGVLSDPAGMQSYRGTTTRLGGKGKGWHPP